MRGGAGVYVGTLQDKLDGGEWKRGINWGGNGSDFVELVAMNKKKEINWGRKSKIEIEWASGTAKKKMIERVNKW